MWQLLFKIEFQSNQTRCNHPMFNVILVVYCTEKIIEKHSDQMDARSSRTQLSFDSYFELCSHNERITVVFCFVLLVFFLFLWMFWGFMRRYFQDMETSTLPVMGIYTWHSLPFSIKGSLACHTMTWHIRLIDNLWKPVTLHVKLFAERLALELSLHVLYKRLRCVATKDRTSDAMRMLYQLSHRGRYHGW